MEVGDWITLGAVIVALGIGVASILHTQNLQKKERKDRLLNEIIEWAIDIIRCGSEAGLQVVPGITEKQQKKLIRINWAFRYQVIESKSEYLINIGSVFKRKDNLNLLIISVHGDLEKAIRITWDLAKTEDIIEEKRLSEEVTKQEEELQSSAKKLIEEATRIKNEKI